MMMATDNSAGVDIQHRVPQHVLRVRSTVPVSELAGAQGQAATALWAFMRKRDLLPAGALYVRYHTFGPEETDVEVGVPVAEPIAGDGPVDCGRLPGGDAIVTWHVGSHDGLADAYARLDTWLSRNGRERNGGAWEVYHWIDPTRQPDPSAWPDPTTWRTELIQPIT